MHSSRMHTARSFTVSRSTRGWVAPPPSVDRMTAACENITLPQTSFAGGKY